MADLADMSDYSQSKLIAEGIETSRKALKGTQPTGFCHYCSEAVADGHRFCLPADSDCRDLFDREARMKGIQGV